MSDTSPKVSDPMNKWFNADGDFYTPNGSSRWSIKKNWIFLNPEFPDSIEYLDQRKIPTEWTLLDHVLTSSKNFRSYQD